jgi:hemerythrin-like domain-containing protein
MPVSPERFVMNTNMHAAFQREVTRLSDALTGLDRKDPVAVAGMKRRFHFLQNVLHAHHEGEDKYLWPTAIAKAGPQETTVLAAMEAEHVALAKSLDKVAADFSELDEESDVEQVQANLADLAQVLQGHCMHEERDGVPIVAKYIEDADLKRLMKEARSAPDSDLVLAWVCDGAPQDIVDSTWGLLPRLVRLFVRPMTERKYRSFTAECGV